MSRVKIPDFPRRQSEDKRSAKGEQVERLWKAPPNVAGSAGSALVERWSYLPSTTQLSMRETSDGSSELMVQDNGWLDTVARIGPLSILMNSLLTNFFVAVPVWSCSLAFI